MHLTVRTAWHDSGWNGRVCKDPEGNVYCSGAHSLLSGRIEKNKNVGLESQDGVAGNLVAQVADDQNGYIPPCYWSLNIQSEQAFDVSQGHAFSSINDRIATKLKPFSFFTWPFRLSFVHSKKQQKKHGNYWPDMEQRIKRYFSKFDEGQSVVFFYANYDNPVSGDEMKYLVTGCSVVNHVDDFTYFDIDSETLEGIKFKWDRKTKAYVENNKMKNFPRMNWAVQMTHDPEKAVFLPYQKYIQYEDGGEQELLSEIKVTVDNATIRNSFKYVSMDLDDDKCLNLLYQMRSSLHKVKEHGIVADDYDAEKQLEKLTDLISLVWKKRGCYPSLSKVLNYYLEDEEEAENIATALVEKSVEDQVCITTILNQIADDQYELLGDVFEDAFEELSENDFFDWLPSCSILSLINLSQNQVNNIIGNNDLLSELSHNPYILFEKYKPAEDDLDAEMITDEAIDFYRIDIALLPDRKFQKKVPIQKQFKESSPVRLRALVRDHLMLRAEMGDTYVSSYSAEREISKHPLLGKDKSNIPSGTIELPTDDIKSSFLPAIKTVSLESENFYYLAHLFQAEKEVSKSIKGLVSRKPHEGISINIDEYIRDSLSALDGVITDDDEKKAFVDERQSLYANIFEQSFFLLTGKPGAGKTFETSQIIEKLNEAGEDVIVLTPTGKASLRVKENIANNTNLHTEHIVVETIDRFIFVNGGGALLIDPDKRDKEYNTIPVQNLIIDESSMIDLWKLYVLFRLIKADEKWPKRIIMVGDENQLPPIGAGRPFYDLVDHFLNDDTLAVSHFSCLQSNCRQKGDPAILELAGAFGDGAKYYNNSLSMLEKEGQQSNGIWVHKWSSVSELNNKIDSALKQVFKLHEVDSEDSENPKFASLNKLLGLYKEGYFPGYDTSKLKIDQWQILTPYRPAGHGTLGINKHIQSNYRELNRHKWKENSIFCNADKVIRLSNWYTGFEDDRKLKLSNGSMGLYSYAKKGESWRFPDSKQVIYSVDDTDNFDLAYAITVHKSQGSDFESVFLIIPEKKALLSRELLYTALTRSKERLFVFIQKSENDLLSYASRRSDTVQRNSSLFTTPQQIDRNLIPEGVSYSVISRIEYIIHNVLTKNGLKPNYEKPLSIKNRDKPIKPDFTLNLPDGRTYYWEHLGMLDQRKYSQKWQLKRKGYEHSGFGDQLITTDDIGGIHEAKIQKVVDDLLSGDVDLTPKNPFSNQHYRLY